MRSSKTTGVSMTSWSFFFFEGFVQSWVEVSAYESVQMMHFARGRACRTAPCSAAERRPKFVTDGGDVEDDTADAEMRITLELSEGCAWRAPGCATPMDVS